MTRSRSRSMRRLCRRRCREGHEEFPTVNRECAHGVGRSPRPGRARPRAPPTRFEPAGAKAKLALGDYEPSPPPARVGTRYYEGYGREQSANRRGVARNLDREQTNHHAPDLIDESHASE